MSETPATSSQAHRRAYSRLRVGIAAHLETLDGQQDVRLLDLSQSGAKVILSETASVRRGVLCWLGFEAFGEVVWREGNQAGLEFEGVLPAESLLETRNRAPTVVRDDALEAARDWASGTGRSGTED